MVIMKLLDTNIVLYFLGGKLPKKLPKGNYCISIITEMELLSYRSLSASSELQIRSFLSAVLIVGLEPEIKESAIQLRRKYSLKLPDAIIAATAFILNAELLTNDKQFSKISDVCCKQLSLIE